jgi:predicted PurR-regulated permease PerM
MNAATEERGRRRSVPWYYRPILLAAGLLLVWLLFSELITLLLAVLVTVLLAIPLSALASWLEGYNVPRALSVVGGVIVGLAVIGGLLTLIIPQLIAQVTSFVDAVPAIVDSVRGVVSDVIGSGDADLGQSIQDAIRGLAASPETLVGPLASVGLGVVGAIGGIVLVLVTAIFIASSPRPLVVGALRLVPPQDRPAFVTVMQRLREAWIGWMRGVLVDMAATGTLLFVGLTIVGLDFALLFAALSALLVVIPYFGPVIGGIPPVLVGLAESPTTGLLVLGVYLVVQMIEANITIPLVLSRTTKIHPALIASGVVIVGQVLGFAAVLVAVPIISTVIILVDEMWVKPAEASVDDELRATGAEQAPDRDGDGEPDDASETPVAAGGVLLPGVVEGDMPGSPSERDEKET